MKDKNFDEKKHGRRWFERGILFLSKEQEEKLKKTKNIKEYLNKLFKEKKSKFVFFIKPILTYG